MPTETDPTFYRTPAEAIAAPPEQLAYVAAYDPAGRDRDAMAVLHTAPSPPAHRRAPPLCGRLPPGRPGQGRHGGARHRPVLARLRPGGWLGRAAHGRQRTAP